MKEYEKRPEVIARRRKMQVTSNDNLHATNAEGFINYERRREEETQ